jgi:hypothetical protein
MRMSGIHVGLLLNFNVPRLVDGLRRYVVYTPTLRKSGKLLAKRA